jgi:hypothetical protein
VWFTFGYTRLGVLAVLVLLTLLPAGMVLNDVDRAGGGWVFLVLDYASQVVITAGYAALVVRMAKRGLRLAAIESDRAGREAARLLLMTTLRPSLLATFAGIASDTREAGEGEDSLDRIRSTADAMSQNIRLVLEEADEDDDRREPQSAFEGAAQAGARTLTAYR